MNSTIRPIFKVDFAKFSICRSREQCMRPTKMKRRRKTEGLKHNPNIHLYYFNEL